MQCASELRAAEIMMSLTRNHRCPSQVRRVVPNRNWSSLSRNPLTAFCPHAPPPPQNFAINAAEAQITADLFDDAGALTPLGQVPSSRLSLRTERHSAPVFLCTPLPMNDVRDRRLAVIPLPLMYFPMPRLVTSGIYQMRVPDKDRTARARHFKSALGRRDSVERWAKKCRRWSGRTCSSPSPSRWSCVSTFTPTGAGPSSWTDGERLRVSLSPSFAPSSPPLLISLIGAHPRHPPPPRHLNPSSLPRSFHAVQVLPP